MKVAAIICEYNPFHKGHKHQIDRTKELCGADAVVGIMSGNFVQRGDVATFPKELRAKAAIAAGVDLVIELPTVFAMQSAEFFSKNAVAIADSLGLVDVLSFGAECNNVDLISKTAKFLCNEPAEFSEYIKSCLSKGISYPSARADAVEKFMGEDFSNILSSPNNILAIEYCKALYNLKSSITPFAVKRIGCDHDSAAVYDGFASATHIRSLLMAGQKNAALSYIPTECTSIFKSAPIHSTDKMEKAILAEIIKMPVERLADISDVSEGMENRIKDASLLANNLEELFDAIKTKRYTHSRIRRIILSAYLGITNKDRDLSPSYIKILDHNQTGQELIRRMKKTASLPIVRNTSQVNKLNNPDIKTLWERERIFDKVYEMFAKL